jgi:uncharacterized protein (DUF2062 family)
MIERDDNGRLAGFERLYLEYLWQLAAAVAGGFAAGALVGFFVGRSLHS